MSLSDVFHCYLGIKKPRSDLWDYWQNPRGKNTPGDYLEYPERSEYLVSKIKKHCPNDEPILELGCNCGRNLNALFGQGYRKLSGVEINKNAAELFSEMFPDAWCCTRILICPIETIIDSFKDSEFYVVFTMAVLEHLPPESEEVFREMARIAGKCIITIEDELASTPKHFPRNYREIFEGYGWKEVESEPCDHMGGLGKGFMCRIFKKGDEK